MNLLNEINKILFNEWDPINVNSNKKLIEEYKNYALEFYRNQKEYKESDVAIYMKLLYYEENEIGLKVNSQVRKKVSLKIYNLLIKNK